MAIRLSGMISGLDTDSIVKELVSAYSTKKDNLVKAQTKLSWKQDAWKDMNSKIYSFYTGSLSNMRFTTFTDVKKTTASDSSKVTVSAGSTAVNGTQTLEITQLAKAAYLTGSKLSTDGSISDTTKLSDLGVNEGTLNLTVSGEAKSITVTSDMTVSGFVSELKNVGLNASFDATQQRFFISSASSGIDNDFSFTEGTSDEIGMLTSLGLATGYATKQAASNSIIKLNGATFENDSNKVTINGLTLNLLSATDTAITITTATDTDAIYNTIKSFFEEYNTLVNSMDAAYNAASSKGYEPLTDDEKDEMSDTEIASWEKKIKDSLLRRDSTLESITEAFTSSMSTAYTINGKKYSLSSFGIDTLGYFVSADNEKHAYHIDGNSEDSTVSNNTDKLRAAIENDPDTVTSFFTQLAGGLYNNLFEKMKTNSYNSSLKSSLKLYNDKQMQSEYDDYTEKIAEQEQKITDMEDYYYKKFSAMETALAKLQSSTSALSSLLGSSSSQ